MKTTYRLLTGAAAAALYACAPPLTTGPVPARTVAVASPNDNRVPAGRLVDGVLRLDLDIVWAGWRPDADVDSAVTVRVFAERGKAPTIPGPLIRVPQGTRVVVTVRNLASDSAVTVHGLRAGEVADDSLVVSTGTTREVEFITSRPGTFLYSGVTTPHGMGGRAGRDAQLSGVIVVDSAGAVRDPDERIFVLSLIDIVPDTTRAPPHEDIWEVAINGLSWPHTERLAYSMGDTARWRFVNATNRPHPMHLHGFHFLVTSKGNGRADTAYTRATQRYAVTELMLPGSTFSLEWNLTRPGNWLVHCHMIPHIVPFPERADSVRGHDIHAVDKHPMLSMAGLVLGVSVDDPHGQHTVRDEPAAVSHRIFLQESAPVEGQRRRKGFLLQHGDEPARDSVPAQSSPLVVVKGQRTSVTVVNRLRSPSSVHWHGMELESVFDGVAGFSGVGSTRAPLIAPGDSFTVWFTPPRAGTYMYHTHMDEEDQLASGMYAPLLVLEPGDTYDPATDMSMMTGLIPNERNGFGRSLNGMASPAPRAIRAGTTYRLRFLHMLLANPVSVELVGADSVVQRWRLISKDGATVPPALSAIRPARVRMGVGETYDFEWTAPAGDAYIRFQFAAPPGVPPPPPLVQKLQAVR